MSVVKGVARVDFWGVQDKRIYLDVSSPQLAELNITPAQILDTLQSQNLVVDAGHVDFQTQRLRVSPTGEFRTPEEIGELAITSVVEGRDEIIRIRDLATVSFGYADPPSHLLRHNGRQAIALAIAPAAGENVVEVGERIDQRINELLLDLPVGIGVERISWQSDQVSESIRSFMISLLQAVTIVLALPAFTMGIRPGIIIGKGPPRFYLPVSAEDPYSSYGQIIVNTTSLDGVNQLVADTDAWVKENVPEAMVRVRKYAVGAFDDWKIEARFSGPANADPDTLRRLAEEGADILRDTPLAKEVRVNWRERVPALEPQYNQERARWAGVSRDDLARVMKRASDGVVVGQYRQDDDLIPIVARTMNPNGNERPRRWTTCKLHRSSRPIQSLFPRSSTASTSPGKTRSFGAGTAAARSLCSARPTTSPRRRCATRWWTSSRRLNCRPATGWIGTASIGVRNSRRKRWCPASYRPSLSCCLSWWPCSTAFARC